MILPIQSGFVSDVLAKEKKGQNSREAFFFIVYYESIKREPKIRGINKCRCDERLQTKTKEFTRLPYTGLPRVFAMKIFFSFLMETVRYLKLHKTLGYTHLEARFRKSFTTGICLRTELFISELETIIRYCGTVL